MRHYPMTAYTDGGCMYNGSPDAYGSWAFVIVGGEERFGPLLKTTNNRAELQAVIEAINHALADYSITNLTVFTDSDLTVKCGNRQWKRRKNLDLWTEFDRVARIISVDLRWVKGHSGIPANDRADELCSMEMLRMELSGEAPAVQPQVSHLRSMQAALI